MKKIQENNKIISFLKFLIHLTAIDSRFIVCGQKSLYLLVEMKIELRNQCFDKIKIMNTSLVGGNFAKSNLSESEFNNVDISGVNLNGAKLFNFKWRNLKIHEQNQLKGHRGLIQSVCFSPDGTTLASVAQMSLSIYGIQRQDIKKQNCMVIVIQFNQHASLLMVLYQQLVAQISLFVYGMLKQGNKKPNQMAIEIMSTQQAFLLMVLLQHMVAEIYQSDYGMLRQNDKKPNWMVIIMMSMQYVSLLMVQLYSIWQCRQVYPFMGCYYRIKKNKIGWSYQLYSFSSLLT
ncbi:unnamed protein product [Paramecium sonneborni]|uniref:Transmembrane protein n=1 Tax=Paramecium sonneborni TaxID=65129 RepID=A0A8S1RRS9_9CILI|nr:unnamed protein product [Paramecium sonneborni]